MSDADHARVEAVLRTVRDAALGTDVVSAGLIRGLTVRDGKVTFALEVSADRGRTAEPLRAACEAAVRTLPGVTSVVAVLTAHRGAPAARAEAGAQGRPAAGPRPLALPGVSAVIAVASGKGGVGKSTLAVNLALGLQALGKHVGLLDADLYGPSVPKLLGVSGRPESDGKRLKPKIAFGLKVMSIGLLVAEDTPTIWRGPMVMSALGQLIADVDWAPLDILVIDMPPGTGDAQLTIAQRVPLAGAVIVSTPQDIALIDARKGIAMFQRTEVPILGLVENMSVFVCPQCGTATHIFGHGGARATAETIGVPFLGEIPLVASIRETSDAGTPVVAAAPQSAEARSFRAVAQAVSDRLETARREPPRIVIA